LIDIAIDELREVEDFSGYRRAITNILRSFISNHDIARITSSAKLIPELRFDLVRQTGEEPEYITGIIDLLAYTEEGVYLMDYKTNIPHTDDGEEFIGHMIETYKPQIDLYREFLADNLGKRVLGSYLYLTSLDRVVDVSQ
jgi:ATP-dependent exoDNAse (exonuclease V) beta subunit